MQDNDFAVLQVKASVTPQAETWPKADYSKTSIMGDKPHVEDSEAFWGPVHDAVAEARARVLKTMGEMAAINENKNLNSVGKETEKQAAAAQAVAAFEKSKKLKLARDAVECRVAQWDVELGLHPKKPETIADAMMAAEIRAHLASLKPGERLAFIDANVGEVGASVLTGPSFLSGLSPAEIGIVRQRIAARTNPKIAAARDEALKALADTEKGWRNAANQIRECGGLKRDNNGAGEAA